MRVLYSLLGLLMLLFHIAPGQAETCRELGGFCQLWLQKPCRYGSLPANCGINAKCCAHSKPPATPDCEKQGGYCHVPLSEECPSGVSYPAPCGINGKCCKPL